MSIRTSRSKIQSVILDIETLPQGSLVATGELGNLQRLVEMESEIISRSSRSDSNHILREPFPHFPVVDTGSTRDPLCPRDRTNDLLILLLSIIALLEHLTGSYARFAYDRVLALLAFFVGRGRSLRYWLANLITKLSGELSHVGRSRVQTALPGISLVSTSLLSQSRLLMARIMQGPPSNLLVESG